MMPLRFGPLICWYFLVYFVVLRVRSLLQPGGMEQFVDLYASPRLLALMVSAHLCFATYSVGVYLLLHRWYAHSSPRHLVVFCLLFVMGVIGLRAVLEEVVLFAIFGEHNYYPGVSWTYYLLDNLYYAIIFLPVGIVYFFTQYGRHTQARRYETEAAFREAELRYLRAQVNPHFLFNTLNNLYAMVSTQSLQALTALEKLSSLLRYSLYHQDERVPLARELAHLHDLIDLESLRIAGIAPPSISIAGTMETWQVPPLLLVPFVENAFKHGRLTDSHEPLSISLTATTERLTFDVVNPVKQASSPVTRIGGIGLQNIRKRLDLLYGSRYELTTGCTGTTFTVHLALYRSAP